LDDNDRDEKYRDNQDKLLKIKGNNRCIRMRRIVKKHAIDLTILSELEEGLDTKIIDVALKHKSLCILRDSDKSDEAIKIRSHLKEMYRNVRQSENETGSRFGYLGFPFLQGNVGNKYFIRGPLALFSASLEYRRSSRPAGWYIVFSENQIRLNKLLFVALEKVGGYSFENIDEEFEDLLENFNPLNPDKNFIELFTSLMKKNEIVIEPDSEIFETQKFKEMKAVDTDAIDSLPLSIKNYKILGSFPQLNSSIYENYTELIEKARAGDSDPLLDSLMGISTDKDIDGDTTDSENEKLDTIPDNEINLVLPSDASQDQIILASQKNNLIVVNGPPGTGKSQVIANLVSNSLTKGERVLVVCDKKAALQVVYERLSEQNKLTGGNLSNHVVLLDKEKDDRAKMYQDLMSFLNNDTKTNTAFRHELSAKSQKIDRLIEKHAKITMALNSEYNGKRVSQLYSDAESGYEQFLDLKGLENGFDFRDLEDIVWTIDNIQENYKKFENPDFSWVYRSNFSELRNNDKKILSETLQTISDNLEECIMLSDSIEQTNLDELTEKNLKTKKELERISRNHAGFLEEIKSLFSKNNIIFDYDNSKQHEKNLIGGNTLWTKFASYEKIISIRQNSHIEISVKKQTDLIDIFEFVKNNSGFKSKLNPTVRQKKKIVEEFITQHNTDQKSAIEKIKLGLDLWNAVTEWDMKSHILETPIILSQMIDQTRSLEIIKLLDSIESEKSKLEIILNETESKITNLLKINGVDIGLNDDKLSEKITRGGNVIVGITNISKYISDHGNDRLLQIKKNNPAQLIIEIRQMLRDMDYFDSLVTFDNEKSKLDEIIHLILKQCIEKFPDNDRWIARIRQEIIYYFIEYVEGKHSALRGEPFVGYDAESKRLQDLLKEKRNLVAANIAIQIEKNTSLNSGKKYDLLHDLKRKRKVKPIRQLMEEYGNIIFNAIPCWLASPDMVSNVFPMVKNLFDLVIVDEASQLAQERAFPFLYRGKRIVVAGDEKQLKPHDLFESKDDDPTNEFEDDEIESFLTLVNKRAQGPRHTLAWHYRSKWQELIDFSNHAFYEKKLQVAPNVRKNPPDPPIKWISVENGFWENRSNMAEAQKITDTLYEILQEYKSKNKHPSIGIITFNTDQRDLIYNVIENRKQEDPEFRELYLSVEFPDLNSSDDEIFIRNIENVQGDQRDIILFSIAYSTAPDSTSKIHTNFGLLSKPGGENRLNVAITRATERIYVICSFEPDHLPVETAKHPGPKLLKQFLKYSKAVSERNDVEKSKVLESVSSGMNIGAGHTSGHSDSPFEDKVKDALVAETKFNVINNVSAGRFRIDLAIVHPKDPTRFILGIECDGAQFHQIESVRERDVSRQNLLESQGWKISRIWSRDYWRKPDIEIKKIVERVNQIIEEESTLIK
jgi:very-short-patch-repair endonuclease